MLGRVAFPRCVLVSGLAITLAAAACSAPLPASQPDTIALAQTIPLRSQAQRPGKSLVWRTAPDSDNAPRAVVQRFFRAVRAESSTALGRVLADDAVFFRPNKDPASALLVWVRRFSALDYSPAVPSTPVTQIHLLDNEAFTALQAIRELHLEPKRGEWLAVVQVDEPRLAKHWGDQVQLILTRDSHEWRIRAIWEDYSQF